MVGCPLLAISWAAWPCPQIAGTNKLSLLAPSKSPTTSVTLAQWCRTSLLKSGRVNSVSWCTSWLQTARSYKSSRLRPSAYGGTSTRQEYWPKARYWSAWCWCSWQPPSPALCGTAYAGNPSWACWASSPSASPTWRQLGFFSSLMGNLTLRCLGSPFLPWVSAALFTDTVVISYRIIIIAVWLLRRWWWWWGGVIVFHSSHQGQCLCNNGLHHYRRRIYDIRSRNGR